MKVHSILDEALGNTSYVIETGDGTAVSVDPRRDVDEHLALASKLQLRIVAVLETHLHADFVSGSKELADAVGAEIVAAAEARLEFSHRPVEAGQLLSFADTTIEVIATPGHTPEHVAFLAAAGNDRAVFSGGSLIVGGAARTDLTGAERTLELARAQYSSLQSLAALPDATVLYPTHGGGSFCSTGPARSEASTIGRERASNSLLQARDVDDFVDQLRRGFGSYPRYFAHLREVNQHGPTLLSSLGPVNELRADEAAERVANGSWLIDARSIEEWGREHAEGSISNALRPSFASWLGWVVPFGAPVVLMLEHDRLDEALVLAHRIGYDAISGWLPFGSWRDAGLPTSSVEFIEPAEVPRRADRGALLLDVRQTSEFEAGHIPGAVHLEAGDIIAGKVPDANEVVTYCQHGERSTTVASLLKRRGIAVSNLRGGFSAWRRARSG